jgi:hypothetical protein
VNVRYRVELSQAERCELTAMLSKANEPSVNSSAPRYCWRPMPAAAMIRLRARWRWGGSTVYRTKRRFVEGNLERALSEDPRPGAERKLTGKEEALLVAAACANPPEGRARWTLELRADAMVKLTGHESLSGETVRRPAGRKQSQALAQGYVVHSPGRRRICRPHGRRARPLCRGARSQAASGLLRREPGPADRRGAPADPGRAGATRTLRLRVSPQRHRQSLHLHRRASALAQGQGHRAAGSRRLRSMHARTCRCPLSRCGVHPGRAGQLVDLLGLRPL